MHLEIHDANNPNPIPNPNLLQTLIFLDKNLEIQNTKFLNYMKVIF